MEAAQSVSGGSRGNYSSSIDRSRIKAIACVSAVIIFGCVAAICLWKGGVSSLANRKLCYVGFASSGVALALAVAALTFGCRKAPKQSQKAAVSIAPAAEAQENVLFRLPMPPATQTGQTPPPFLTRQFHHLKLNKVGSQI